MSIVLITDTETNSLDTQSGFIQEIAFARYHVECKRFISMQSYFLRWDQIYMVEAEAQAVTGLSFAFTEGHGKEASQVFSDFLNELEISDYLCGHNILGFDRDMIASNLQKFPVPGYRASALLRKPVIDTLIDLPYPPSQKTLALKYLSLDHGFILHNAHSALADVQACGHLLGCYPFEKVQEISSTPLVRLETFTSWDNTEKQRELKRLKFYWNKPKKCWEARVREYFLPQIREVLGLPIAVHEIIPETAQQVSSHPHSQRPLDLGNPT